MQFYCNYSQPGTYGHECGRPAVYALPLHSERNSSGVYYARRCNTCRDKLEHADRLLSDPVPFNPSLHTNSQISN